MGVCVYGIFVIDGNACSLGQLSGQESTPFNSLMICQTRLLRFQEQVLAGET